MTRTDEHKLASFFARPEFSEVRPILEHLLPGSVEKIEAVMRRVRVEQWRDFSKPEDPQ